MQWELSQHFRGSSNTSAVPTHASAWKQLPVAVQVSIRAAIQAPLREVKNAAQTSLICLSSVGQRHTLLCAQAIPNESL